MMEEGLETGLLWTYKAQCLERSIPSPTGRAIDRGRVGGGGQVMPLKREFYVPCAQSSCVRKLSLSLQSLRK